MPGITRNGVRIDDSFAEAFPMRGTALLITGPNRKWARQAAVTMTGFATSVIGCGVEAGIDGEVDPRDTPDGRPGVRVLIFAMSSDRIAEAAHQSRRPMRADVARARPASPISTAPEQLKLGDALRYFGDGWQISKKFGDRHFWRIPVMDGEFLCEATTGFTKGAVGGGNLLSGRRLSNRPCAPPRRRSKR